MKHITVIFAEPKYNYKTSCSSAASDESIRKYFVGKQFNVSPYKDENQAENLQTCINIEIQ